MGEKRRDLRGRVLRTGESQIKEGKFRGRYQFDYTDNLGMRRHCNSWRLTAADPVPEGKRMCKPLRDIEQEIAELLHDGIDIHAAKNKTLNDCFDDVMKLNVGIKQSTRKSYLDQWECVRDTLGKRKVIDIKYSDVKRFYISLLEDKKINIATVTLVNARVRSAFALAVRDKIIIADPSQGILKELRKTAKKNPKRHALTKYEQETFLRYWKDFCGFSGKYLLFVVMFGTGMRISEVLALTWDDVNFDGNYISVNKGLMYEKHETGLKRNNRFYISTTKTENSNRVIPMLPEVREALIRLKEINTYHDKGFSVDGVSGFVFINGNACCYVPTSINDFIRKAVKKINTVENINAAVEGRESRIVRNFTAHCIRHTFCTRLCEQNVPPKVIQSVMGHANIQTTFDIYAECTKDLKVDVFASLDGIVLNV